MKATTAADVADFFHQLALLVKSDLPLPDSLRQLARYFPKREFRNAVAEIAENVSRGDKFSDAAKRHPAYFDSFLIALIAAGEASGTFPEVMFAVARLMRFRHLLLSEIRVTLAYPVFSIHLCAAVFLFLSICVIPLLKQLMDPPFIYPWSRMPFFTRVVLGVTGVFAAHWKPVVSLYSAFALFTVWLFTPGLTAHKALLAIVNRMPGSWRIVNSLDSARVCGMLSTLLEQHSPLPQALTTVSRMVESGSASSALVRAAQNIESGMDAAEALLREPAIDRLIVLTFKHTPEAELARDLRWLGELFEHRVIFAANAAQATWTVLTTIVLAIIVGSVAVALFLCMARIVGGGY